MAARRPHHVVLEDEDGGQVELDGDILLPEDEASDSEGESDIEDESEEEPTMQAAAAKRTSPERMPPGSQQTSPLQVENRTPPGGIPPVREGHRNDKGKEPARPAHVEPEITMHKVGTDGNVDMEELFQELGLGRRKKRARGNRKKRRKKTDLDDDQSDLMGKATLAYTSRNYQELVRICSEVLRRNPMAIEPYNMMGLAYEELGDMARALQFKLVGAHLNPKDSGRWVELAGWSRDEGDLAQAVYCLNKAIRFNEDEADKPHLLWDRSYLQYELGQHQRAASGFEEIRRLRPGNKQVSQMLAQIYHANLDDTAKAIAVLEESYRQNFTDAGDAEILVEYYMAAKQYEKALKTALDVSPQNLGVLTPTLRAKIGHCLSKLGRLAEAEEHYQYVIDRKCVKEFEDIAVVYMEEGNFDKALSLLEALVVDPNATATAWYYKGICEKELGVPQDAADSWEAVLELVPNDHNVRIHLSELYKEMGDAEAALHVLETQETMVDMRLAIGKCDLLYTQRQYAEFLESSYPLVQRFSSGVSGRAGRSKRDKRIMRENEAARQVSRQDWVSLLLRTVKVLLDVERTRDAYLITKSVCDSRDWEEEFRSQINYLRFVTSAAVREWDESSRYLRMLLVENPDSQALANGFNAICVLSEDYYTNNHRRVMRLFRKFPGSIPIAILSGNMLFAGGHYKFALVDYHRAYISNPSSPELALMMGLSLLNQASNRSTIGRNMVVLHGLAYMYTYYRLRRGDQEACYNLARAFHLIGLLHLALPLYEQVLRMPSVAQSRRGSRAPALTDDNSDLKYEAAYNLALMYRSSGNEALARQTLSRYCTI